MLTYLLCIYWLGFAGSLFYLLNDAKESQRGGRNFIYASIWFVVPILILIAIVLIFILELFKIKNEDSDTSA